MVIDHGTRTTAGIRRLRRVGMTVGISIGVAVCAAYLATTWRLDQAKAVAEAREWIVPGPPCPEVARRADLPRWGRGGKAVDYDDVVFTYAMGHMSCTQIAYRDGRGFLTYPVCQFSAPAALEVATPKGVTRYAPGIGQGVTVSVPHGQTRCVLGAPEFPTLGQMLREGR